MWLDRRRGGSEAPARPSEYSQSVEEHALMLRCSLGVMEEAVSVDVVQLVLWLRVLEAAFVVDFRSLKTATKRASELTCNVSACVRSQLDNMPAWGNMS